MRLRLVNALVYAALAAFAMASIATPLRAALGAVAARFAYTPNLALPWLWVSLGAALFVLVTDLARTLAAGRRAGMVRYLLLLAVVVASIAARKTVTSPARPTVTDGLSNAIARVELAGDAAFARDRRYPADDAAFAAALPEAVKDLGYRARGGLLLTTRVVVHPDAIEPVLRSPDARPGDVIFAVDRDGQRYWITAFVLDRRGRASPLLDGAGRVVVAAGVEGHARSRLDLAFPEYPRTVPMRGVTPSP